MTHHARRSLIQVVLVGALGLALTSASAAPVGAAYFPPAGEWARKDPAALGMDPAALAAAVQFAQSRETERPLDFSDQEAHLRDAAWARCRPAAPQTNGAGDLQGLRRGRVRRHALGRSDLLGGQEHAGHRGRRGRARRALCRSTSRSAAARQRRRLRLAAQRAVTWKMHLQQETEWEGELCGKNRRLHRQGRLRRGRDASRAR